MGLLFSMATTRRSCHDACEQRKPNHVHQRSRRRPPRAVCRQPHVCRRARSVWSVGRRALVRRVQLHEALPDDALASVRWRRHVSPVELLRACGVPTIRPVGTRCGATGTRTSDGCRSKPTLRPDGYRAGRRRISAGNVTNLRHIADCQAQPKPIRSTISPALRRIGKFPGTARSKNC